MRSPQLFALVGALSGAVAVAAGAFGAHALHARLAPELLTVFETAVRYQMFHVVGLFAAAWAAGHWPGAAVRAGGACFLLGTLVFCGSLYALALTGTRGLGAITPFGGLLFIAGWLLLAWGIGRGNRSAY
jgi:uncharacterized membrane protein YgdD (TMEM256/DUF423 family)